MNTSDVCIVDRPVRQDVRPGPVMSDTADTAVPRLDVWRLRFEPAAPLPAEMAVLDDAEQRRAADLLFPQERRRFVMGRAYLRRVLGHYAGQDPRAIEMTIGRNGKPALANSTESAEHIGFNLSHDRSGCLIGVVRGLDLGVDLEIRHRVLDRNELARACFSRQEIGAVQACRDGTRDDAFLRIWTRKEAVLKASGAGLSEAPNRFEVNPELKVQTIRFGPRSQGERMSYCIVDLSDDTTIAAAAVRGHDGPLTVHERRLDEPLR